MSVTHVRLILIIIFRSIAVQQMGCVSCGSVSLPLNRRHTATVCERCVENGVRAKSIQYVISICFCYVRYSDRMANCLTGGLSHSVGNSVRFSPLKTFIIADETAKRQ